MSVTVHDGLLTWKETLQVSGICCVTIRVSSRYSITILHYYIWTYTGTDTRYAQTQTQRHTVRTIVKEMWSQNGVMESS